LGYIIENPYKIRKEWIIEIFETEGRKNPNNKIFRFWQQDNHPLELTSNKMMDQKQINLGFNTVACAKLNRPKLS